MIDLIRRYRDYLIARTEALGPRTRWFEVRFVLFPWFSPAFLALAVCVLFQPGERERLLIVLPLGAIGLIGMIYAGAIFMIYGIRADVRRMNEAKRSERQ